MVEIHELQILAARWSAHPAVNWEDRIEPARAVCIFKTATAEHVAVRHLTRRGPDLSRPCRGRVAAIRTADYAPHQPHFTRSAQKSPHKSKLL